MFVACAHCVSILWALTSAICRNSINFHWHGQPLGLTRVNVSFVEIDPLDSSVLVLPSLAYYIIG